MNARCFISETIPVTLSILMLVASQPGQAAPANDMFANRTVLTGTNITLSVNNTGATLENGEPQDYYSPGGASVWWSWKAPFSGFVTIRTANNGLDTILAVFTGSSITNLTNVAFNDDEVTEWGLTNSYIYTDVKGGETYQISADGFLGATGDIVLTLQLEPYPVAPEWSLLDPYGNMIYSTNFAGKVVVFDFWATWCDPCKAEMPDFVSLQEQYGEDGLVVVGAACGGDTWADVINFLATFSPAINYQLVMADDAILDAYRVVYIPATFIIDRQNRLRKIYVGQQTRETFESSILPLLYAGKVGPGLTYEKTNSTYIFIRWPTNEPTCTLQWTANITDPFSWADWPTGPRVVNSSNRVQIAIGGKAKYFRLNMPY